MGSNCAVSTTIGCLFCCKGCSAEKLQNAFTFVPPPKSYEVKVEKLPLKTGPGLDLVVSYGKLVYCASDLRNDSYYKHAAEKAEVRFLRTSLGDEIPIVWLPRVHRSTDADQPNSGRNQRWVLLHCHGNATDIGMMMGPFYRLSKHLGVDVVGVEYAGYGVATGTPSVRGSLQDVEAAYALLVAAGVPSEQIIVYGQSVGCGPAIHLAATHRLGGVILHSPMLSGIKVIDPQPDASCRPSCVWHCFDFYPNQQHMKNISCPVFVMHGQKDTIIPFYHGYRLTQTIPEEHRWPGYFPAGAGHNDIIELDTGTYFEKMHDFLERVMNGNTAALSRPAQVEMNPPHTDAGLAEPKVGPEDGRYQKLRQGKVVAGTANAARELQLA